jgi:hypothetical protein
MIPEFSKKIMDCRKTIQALGSNFPHARSFFGAQRFSDPVENGLGGRNYLLAKPGVIVYKNQIY